jgi:hypothetical protein
MTLFTTCNLRTFSCKMTQSGGILRKLAQSFVRVLSKATVTGVSCRNLSKSGDFLRVQKFDRKENQLNVMFNFHLIDLRLVPKMTAIRFSTNLPLIFYPRAF